MKKADYTRTSVAAKTELSSIGLVSSSLLLPTNVLKKKYQAVLKEYSSNSEYQDNIWVIDLKERKMNFSASERTFNFCRLMSYPHVLRSVKEWSLNQLVQGRKIKGIRSSLGYLLTCFECIAWSGEISEITEKELLKLYDFLMSGHFTKYTAVAHWNCLRNFFQSMNCAMQAAKMSSFIIPIVRNKKIEKKYIPDDIAKQLDKYFSDTSIPLAQRCLYWTLRLYPCRIEEVVSMDFQCLSQISDDLYMLSIPVNKTSSSFDEPENKTIYIKYEGTGKVYVDLLKEQLSFAQTYADDSPFIFKCRRVVFKKGSIQCRETGKKIYTIHSKNVSSFFARVCKALELRDSDGIPVSTSTHMFRHNAVSDRVNDGGFRSIDVAYLTGHKNTAMIEKTYTHRRPVENPEIRFRGRIISSNDHRIVEILKRPYAQPIYKLGICSDSRGCAKNRAACLRCDNNFPDESCYDDFLHEKLKWEEKLQKSINIGNTTFADVCRDWIDAYDVAIAKIERRK